MISLVITGIAVVEFLPAGWVLSVARVTIILVMRVAGLLVAWVAGVAWVGAVALVAFADIAGPGGEAVRPGGARI